MIINNSGVTMDFEKLNFNKCLTEDCNQQFTQDNIKLAIWLYGVILLIKNENDDPIGYVGVTCPKCLKTNFYEGSAQDIHLFKSYLSSQLEIMKLGVSEDGNRTIETINSFEPSLRYYSPFCLNREAINKIEVISAGYSQPEENPHFSDQFQSYINVEMPELQKQFCSYIADNDKPMGGFSSILWFKNEDISNLLAYENEKQIRVFPRHIYQTDLISKIDSLLEIHYYMGKQFDQAKEDHKKNRQADLEDLKAYTRENNLNYENITEGNGLNGPQALINIIEENQKRIAKDPKISGMFLDVLISDPFPLGNSLIQNKCDYLWAKVDPFQNEDMPEYFINDIGIEGFKDSIKDMKAEHFKMVARIQENYTKQYVQEFLKDNLVDFLEEYEDLIQSNSFSYADIWRLKESYLEGLYKTILKGLSEVAPYVMKREMDAWKIIFNNIKTEKLLIGVGFAYVYYLLCNENEYYYHADLIREGGNVSIEPNNDNVEYNDTSSSTEPEPMISKEDLHKLSQDIKTKENKLSDAKDVKDQNKVATLENELEDLKKFRGEVYNPKTKGPRYFKNENNKKAVDSVGNAIKRALTSLAKKHPEAHQHIFKALDGKHLYRETLSYSPAPEEKVDWIFA